MAKDDPTPESDDPKKPGNSEDQSDQYETRASDDGEKTVPDVLESTIDSIDEVPEPAVGEKTTPNILESTIDSIEDDSASGVGKKTGGNPLESTVDSLRPQPPTHGGKIRRGARQDETAEKIGELEEDKQFDTIDPFGMNSAQKTVDGLQLDQTVDLEGTKDLDQTVDVPVDDVAATHDTTIGGSIDYTIDLDTDFGETPGREDTVDGVSAMDSPDVSQTINPRELSKKDAALWDSLAVSKSAHGQQTKNIPAVERSFSETKLAIRPRQVVTPKHAPSTPSDYRLIRLLGKGGMGNVYVAKQESLDRMIAVKVIKPLDTKKRKKLQQSGRLDTVEADRRHQFLSEAVVTGDLDHPNIVPIYDIAVTADESLFYAMKRVVGTPWSKVIHEKSLDENLEILLKACDAVGFAHTRGVVHRDIKPENIMLGDFGVVMVMDWGLALAKPTFQKLDSIVHTAGLGGTPAFMAPEMATGPVQKIGPSSDIYLLGATLYQIITGNPPHQAESVSACIKAVTENKIRAAAPEHQGELMNIALKAMSTHQQDRHPDVVSFQDEIREYRSHAESITLANRAQEDLDHGEQNRDYKTLSRATFGFEEAIALWPGNESARDGLGKTKLIHAESAYANGDFDLGLSLLDPDQESHQPVIAKLQDGLDEREQRQARLVLLKRATAAMLAFILVGGAVALYLINDQRKKAQVAQEEAETNWGIAQEQKQKALDNLKEADAQRKIAEANEQKAIESGRKEAIARQEAEVNEEKAIESQRKEAIARQEAETNEKLAIESGRKEAKARVEEAKARQKAEESEQKAVAAAVALREEKQKVEEEKQKFEYEVYLSQIGLAKARIEQNEFDDARRILADLKKERGTRKLGWEWRWLARQAFQFQAGDETPAAPLDLTIDRSGRGGAVVLEDGSIELISLDKDSTVISQTNFPLPRNAEATCVAIAPGDDLIAVGTKVGDIQIWDRNMTRPVAILSGHDDRITDVLFTPSGLLISGSIDRTARIWNPSGGELADCWHIAPVRQVAVAQRGSSTVLVTAVADSSSGRAVVWQLSGSSANVNVEKIGEFLEHSGPVSSIAISPQADLVATGDVMGNVLVWKPVDVQQTDYASAIAAAVRGTREGQNATTNRSKRRTPAKRLIDSPDFATQFVSIQSGSDRVESDQPKAHNDIIESLQFSSDGKRLLSTSDDYTLKLWDIDSESRIKTLRGHGGWVTDAEFVAGSTNRILSVSRDSTIRAWDSSTYVGAVSMVNMNRAATNGKRESQAHTDEIWSARFDASGSRIVTASHDQTARILRIDPQKMTFKEIARLQDSEESVDKLDEGTSFLAMSVVVDRRHGRLYVGSADSTVRAWDLNLGTEVGQASGTGLNTSLALSDNGRLLLTGSSSKETKAILWDIDPVGSVAPRQRFRLKGHDQAVTAFAISRDGSRLFTGDRIGVGILWDANTGKEIAKIGDMRGFRINAAGFSPDGDFLLVASDDQQLSVIDVKQRKRVDQFAHDGFVTQLSLSEDGKRALTVDELRTQAGFQATATLWNLQTRKSQVLERVKREISRDANQRSRGERIDSARFGPQSRLAVISCSTDGQAGEVKVFSIAPSTAKVGSPAKLQLPAKLGSAQVAMPVSGQQMLTLNGDAAFLWDLRTMSHIKSYRAHAAVTHASFSFDGRYVTTGSRSVKIWDAKTGLSVSKLESPHRGPVRAVQFSPAGPNYILATASDDGVARVWKWDPATKTFQKLRELTVTRAQPDKPADVATATPILSLAFSSDGRSLLTTGAQGTVRLWNLQDSGQVNFDVDQPVAFTCGAVSADGKWIAVGSDDKLARMWAVPAAGLTVESPITFEGHADRIEDIKILLSNLEQPRVLTASRDKSARVWDPRLTSEDKKAREVIALRRHTQGVTAIDVTQDGNLVMTAGRDGAVILWPASPQEAPTDPENVFDNL